MAHLDTRHLLTLEVVVDEILLADSSLQVTTLQFRPAQTPLVGVDEVLGDMELAGVVTPHQFIPKKSIPDTSYRKKVIPFFRMSKCSPTVLNYFLFYTKSTLLPYTCN